jgi:hypothetical protein
LAQREATAVRGEHRIAAALIVALLVTSAWFRLWHLSSMPGISGDEGWWGMQALAWRAGRPYQAHTTSGNPIDLFLLIPLALLHEVAAPSFTALRILPALVNVLALPVAFWFVRRIYGSVTAWVHTVAIAVAPTAIAHSRICQDPSQTIFWTGLVIYLSLLAFTERSRAWLYGAVAMVVFPIALWTHPTNVFIAPFLVIAAVAVLRTLPRPGYRATAFFVLPVAVLLVMAIRAWPALVHFVESNESLNKPWLSQAAGRMIDPAQWIEFVVNTARLFNGVTVYHYFSGARPWTLPYDAGFVIVMLAVLSGLWMGYRERPRRGTGVDNVSSSGATLDVAVIAASAAALLLFYAFAGPKSLRPSAERWGLCLIVPGLLVVSRGTSAWIELRPRLRIMAIAAAGLIAAALLASFYVNYFREFATTGGRAHLTYITAPVEPKQQALARILAAGGGDRPVVIVAREWWLFWPIAYLASPHANVSVTRNLPPDDPSFREALSEGRVFVVEFAGTAALGTAIDWIRASGLRFTQAAVQDAGGRDVLAILQITRSG